MSWKSAWRRFVDIVDDWFIYFATVATCFFVPYLSFYNSGEPFEVDLRLVRVAGAMLIALRVAANEEKVSDAVAKEKRKGNFVRRLENAVTRAFTYTLLAGMGG